MDSISSWHVYEIDTVTVLTYVRLTSLHWCSVRIMVIRWSLKLSLQLDVTSTHLLQYD